MIPAGEETKVKGALPSQNNLNRGNFPIPHYANYAALIQSLCIILRFVGVNYQTSGRMYKRIFRTTR